MLGWVSVKLDAVRRHPRLALDSWRHAASGEAPLDSRSHLGFEGVYELFKLAFQNENMRLGIISEFGVQMVACETRSSAAVSCG
jgi:hypothetical protein